MRYIHLVALFLVVNFYVANAQQGFLSGGEITYQNIGVSNYEFTLTLYRDCAKSNFQFLDSYTLVASTKNAKQKPVSFAVTKQGTDSYIRSCEEKPSKCEGGDEGALVKRTFVGRIRLPSQQRDWTISFRANGRTDVLNTISPSSQGFFTYLEATINNVTSTLNSSISFANQPVPFVIVNRKVTIDPGLVNDDQDNFDVSLVPSKVSDVSSVSYLPGFSATKPLTTNGNFDLNTSTGEMTFTPTDTLENTSFAMVVKEYRNGVLLGSVMREMQMIVLSDKKAVNTEPFFEGTDTLRVCEGDTIRFSYEGKAKVPTANLDITWNNKSSWGDGAVSQVVKKPGSAVFKLNKIVDFSSNRSINLTLFDDQCPTGRVSKNIYVVVSPKQTGLFNIGADLALICFKQVFLTANITGGTPPYKYEWNTSSDQTSTIPITSPNRYIVKVTDAKNCVFTMQRRISTPVNYIYERYCVDSLTTFYDMSLGNFSIRPFPIGSTTKWVWNYGDGSTNDTNTVAIAKHKFPAPGDYQVTMTISSSDDCDGSVTKTVHICDKTPIDFAVIDTCVQHGENDLFVQDSTSDSTACSVVASGIKYFVDDKLIGSPGAKGAKYGLKVKAAGLYNVKMRVQNSAGCVSEVEKEVKVYPKPVVLKGQKGFFFQCGRDSIDTSFVFGAKAIGLAFDRKPSLDVLLTRTGYPDINLVKVDSTTSVEAPFKAPNAAALIKFTVTDTLGCTADTSVVITDPINISEQGNPSISLKKYYCFVGDTLKLVDDAFNTPKYHWPITKAIWNMGDGDSVTTIGFANHVYDANDKNLDEADVKLTVTDSTGCVKSTLFKVYLSEPDTSEFKLSKTEACFGDTVLLTGTNSKYINSWYFRFKDTLTSIYDKPDKVVFNKTFQDQSDKLTASLLFPSKQYIATQTIFYNEPDTTKNFQRRRNPATAPVVPRKPTNVCRITKNISWLVANQLKYGIASLADSNQCFETKDKRYRTSVADSSSNILLEPTTWKWTFFSPKGNTLSTSNTLFEYNTGKLDTVATDRASLLKTYPPYVLKLNYSYKFTNNSLECKDSTNRRVANEKLDVNSLVVSTPDPVSCLDENLFPVVSKGGPFWGAGVDAASDSVYWSYNSKQDSSFTDDKGNPPTQPLSVIQTQAGTYVIKAKLVNKYGCVGFAKTTQTVKPIPNANLSVDTVCYGATSLLDGSKSLAADPTSFIKEYYWTYGDGSKTDTTSTGVNTKEHKYQYPVNSTKSFPVQLTVKDSNGCTSTVQGVVAVVNVQPSVDFNAIAKLTNDKDYLANEPILFNETSQNVKYWRWNMGDGKIIESPLGATGFDIEYTYPYYPPPASIEKNMYDISLFVQAEGGCTDTASMKIDANSYFVLPTAFTPNEDGLHDVWIAVGKGIKEIKQFKIFNRWGEVIHTLNGKLDEDDLKRGYLIWDGKLKGEPQPIGAYVYYGVLTTAQGVDIELKGNFSLLK
jgi:gliding motility-associated-like protein